MTIPLRDRVTDSLISVDSFIWQKIESLLLDYEVVVGESVENGINVVTQVGPIQRIIRLMLERKDDTSSLKKVIRGRTQSKEIIAII